MDMPAARSNGIHEIYKFFSSFGTGLSIFPRAMRLIDHRQTGAAIGCAGQLSNLALRSRATVAADAGLMTATIDHSEVDRADLAAMAAVMLGVTIVTLDISLTSTAVPAIAGAIGADPAGAIWIVNIYFIAVVAALLPLAALGEILGHRRVFFSGLVVFALGALACGLAQSLPVLIIGRAVAGFGAAAVSATAPALIRAIYPPHRLGRGLGLYALVVGVAFTIGPTATSAILSIADWPWLFVLTIPPALIAFGLAVRGLPPTIRNPRPFDTLSAVLCAATFGCILFSIAGIGRIGWLALASALAAGVVFACALRWRESGKPAPILAVDLFRIPIFSLSAATSACAFLIQGLVFVALPFLFQTELSFSQVEAGLLITPWPATLALMTLIAAPLADRIAPGLLGGVGLILLALGLVSLAVLPAGAAIADIIWRLVLCGVGFGFFQSPNMLAIMSSAPSGRSGGASGILAASRLFGQSIGAAVVAICLSAASAEGIRLALWVGVAAAVLGSLFSVLRLLPMLKLRE